MKAVIGAQHGRQERAPEIGPGGSAENKADQLILGDAAVAFLEICKRAITKRIVAAGVFR